MAHIIPDPDPKWLNATPVVVRKGCYPTCIVLRPWDCPVTPFVVHRAIAIKGKWEYEQGSYCLSRTAADEAFFARSGGA